MRYPRMTRGVRFDRDDGQVLLSIVFGLSTILGVGLAVGVDMTNLFFHRTAAQGAADAACQAAAMDMLLHELNGTQLGGFTPGTNFDCATTSSAAPCKYAALNGYSSPGLTAGAESNDVSASFPASVPGVTAPPAAVGGSYPFIQISVVDRVRTYFLFLLSGSTTSDVAAKSTCGLVLPGEAAPIIVLHPTLQDSFTVNGSALVKVSGGPNRSVQVNSSNATAAYYSGSAVVDLSQGGTNFTGSDFAVVGGPGSAFPSPHFNGGTTGGWVSPTLPLNDPFATLSAPTVPTAPSVPPDPYPSQCTTLANPCTVPYHVDGCPDTKGCLEYGPGLYTSPITLNGTTLFDPGLYYIAPTGGSQYDLIFQGSTVVRPSNTGDGTGGIIFYFSGAAGHIGSINISSTGTQTLDPFYTAGGGPANNPSVTCPGGKTPTPALPTTVGGNVLMGVCSGTYGDPLGDTRGMLMFADRSNSGTSAWNQPNLSGSGGLLLAGNLYFHNCVGTPCTGYNQLVTISGASGSTTDVVGEIVADQLLLTGNGSINMNLSPYGSFSLLKAALLQ